MIISIIDAYLILKPMSLNVLLQPFEIWMKKALGVEQTSCWMVICSIAFITILISHNKTNVPFTSLILQ